MYEEPMAEWLNRNFAIRSKINEIRPGLYDYTLFGMTERLSYNELKKLDQVNLRYLIILCYEIMIDSHYKSENDIGLKDLLRKIDIGLKSRTW
jgi:hypothetical protein